MSRIQIYITKKYYIFFFLSFCMCLKYKCLKRDSFITFLKPMFKDNIEKFNLKTYRFNTMHI